MSFVDYLLFGFGFVLVIAFCTLLLALRRAGEGHEDSLGFHVGAPGTLSVLASVVSALPEVSLPATPGHAAAGPGRPAEGDFSLETASPFVPKARRRSPHSRPPLLPANLTLDDFNPQPPSAAVISRRAKKSGDSAAPLPTQSQFPFPDPSA